MRHHRHAAKHRGHHGHFYGIVKVGERGQIAVPKEAREDFEIEPGDSLMVVGRKGRGLAIVKTDGLHGLAAKMFDKMGIEDTE